MNRGVVITILAVILALLVGGAAYQMGIAQGLATAGQATPGAVMPYAGHYGWGFGFPFFGILFPILFFFLIFGLIGAAFRGPRWGNGGPWMDRRTMLEEWHQKLHAESGRTEPGSPRRDT